MLHLDAVGRWITATTGRTLDQHAADPIPAAAHLPDAAATLRHLRTELLLAVDRLRTLLINTDDLTGTVATVAGTVETITQLAREYRHARDRIDTLIADQARAAYAQAHPGQVVRRRYVNPGDTVLVTLPHTDSCRRQNLAGHATHIRVGTSDARLRPPGSVNPLRLSHTTPASTTTRPTAPSTSWSPRPTSPPPPATEPPAAIATATGPHPATTSRQRPAPRACRDDGCPRPGAPQPRTAPCRAANPPVPKEGNPCSTTCPP